MRYILTTRKKQPILISPSSLCPIFSLFHLETASLISMATFLAKLIQDNGLIYKGFKAEGLRVNTIGVKRLLESKC